MFENHQKVSFYNIASEASYAYILALRSNNVTRWSISDRKKIKRQMRHFWWFWNTVYCIWLFFRCQIGNSNYANGLGPKLFQPNNHVIVIAAVHLLGFNLKQFRNIKLVYDFLPFPSYYYSCSQTCAKSLKCASSITTQHETLHFLNLLSGYSGITIFGIKKKVFLLKIEFLLKFKAFWFVASLIIKWSVRPKP